jgi:peptidoglycan/LPS O-acetylase OafA/YrhL
MGQKKWGPLNDPIALATGQAKSLNNRPWFIPAIESMRGIAALTVSLAHVYGYWLVNRLPPSVATEFWNEHAFANAVRRVLFGAGASAVTLFFVVSGFVLLISLQRAAEKPTLGAALQFGVSRIFRIYPALVVVILAWAVTEPWFLFGSTSYRPLSEVVRNLSLFDATMDLPTWSTRVEIAATPVLFLAWLIRLRWRERGLFAVIIALALCGLASSLYAEDMIGRYIFCFALGAILPDVASIFARLPRSCALGLLAAAVMTAIAARPFIFASFHSQYAIWVEAGCYAIVVGLIVYADLPAVRRFLELSLCRWFGRISYSYYLIHFMILLILLRHVPDWLISAMTGNNYFVGAMLVFVAVFCLTTALSIAMYGFIERPLVAVGRRLSASAALTQLQDRRGNPHAAIGRGYGCFFNSVQDATRPSSPACR